MVLHHAPVDPHALVFGQEVFHDRALASVPTATSLAGEYPGGHGRNFPSLGVQSITLRDAFAQEIIKEIADATESKAGAEQAVRDLWMQHATQAVQWTPGRPISFQSPQVLLAIMRELTRKGWSLGHNLPPSCWESAEIGMREMRRSALAPSCASDLGRSVGQPSSISEVLVSVLSVIIAHAARKWAVNRDPLNLEADKRDNRVGRLRGFGNAIVPQVAAIFVQEFLGAFAEIQENTGG
ncbi:hypothetical protein [Acetobacter sp.]|uniref:hypothetical protein n=1 Tax=Acetobacter sp. TaxID=440 RepID=UPI0039EBF6C3